MEKVETKDFMNVDSFSQLPFIRPAPAKDKAAVRLFGIEFQNTASEEATSDQNNNVAVSETDVMTSTTTGTTTTTTTSTETQNNGSGRKFECHYCCRNFPTSQALGGHQNAHKRERQHAKRAYLQSAAMLHHPTGPTDHHHLYGGVLGYHHRYPSWSSSSTTSTTTTNNNYHDSLRRYYPSSYHSYPSSSLHHHRQPPAAPINGSPLSMWRIPSVQVSANRDRSLLQHQYLPPHPPLPLLASSGSGVGVNDVSQSSSQKYVLEPKNKGFQDHVSLDLHL